MLISTDQNSALADQNTWGRVKTSRNLVKEEGEKKRVQLLESHKLSKVSYYATDLNTISL